MLGKVSDENTYPFSNFNGETVEVWECRGKQFHPTLYNGCNHLFRKGAKAGSSWSTKKCEVKSVVTASQTLILDQNTLKSHDADIHNRYYSSLYITVCSHTVRIPNIYGMIYDRIFTN